MKTLSRIFLSFFIALFFVYNLMGQSNIKRDSADESNAKVQPTKSSASIKTPRISYSMELGAGYFGSSNLFSGTFTNISPSLNYIVSPKLKIEFGGTFTTGNTSFSQNSVLKLNPNLSSPTNQFFVFTNGQYALTNRLMLTGSFYTTLNSNKSPQINPYFLDYKGMNLGLDYKIGKNMSIGAQFRISNGYNNSLFDQPGIGSFSHFGRNDFGW